MHQNGELHPSRPARKDAMNPILTTGIQQLAGAPWRLAGSLIGWPQAEIENHEERKAGQKFLMAMWRSIDLNLPRQTMKYTEITLSDVQPLQFGGERIGTVKLHETADRIDGLAVHYDNGPQ